jgi:DNA-directed RNA polymerase subunit RPC12/RpoP
VLCNLKENPATIETMKHSDLTAESEFHGDQRQGESGALPPGLVCPACGSKLIRRSMRRTFKDRLMSMLGKFPYRCQMCNMRFSGPQDPASLARENAASSEEELLGDERDEGNPPEESKHSR